MSAEKETKKEHKKEKNKDRSGLKDSNNPKNQEKDKNPSQSTGPMHTNKDNKESATNLALKDKKKKQRKRGKGGEDDTNINADTSPAKEAIQNPKKAENLVNPLGQKKSDEISKRNKIEHNLQRDQQNN